MNRQAFFSSFLSFLLCTGALLLAGCSALPDWIGAEEETKLEGKRFTILPEQAELAIDPATRNRTMSLPAPQANGAWYNEQAIAEDGGSILRNVALKGSLQREQGVASGNAPADDAQLTSAPLIIGNVLLMLDGKGLLTARALPDAEKTLWQVDLARLAVPGVSASGKEAGWQSWLASREDFIGGNLGFVEGSILATTHSGHVFAFNLEDGKLQWHRAMGVTIQSAPSGRNGSVYFVTGENQLYALSLKTGETLWTHNGIPQQTKILGAPAPVVLSELVLVPYSSGEVVALKQVNGLKLWEENINPPLAGALAFRFSDIQAAPVAVAGRLFVSSEGQLVAIDTLTGNRFWQLPLTLTSTPWAAGEWLFALTAQAELVAVHGGEGRIRWRTELPAYADEKKKEHIRWSGPVLAEGALVVVGSNGELRRFNPDTGALETTLEISEGVKLPPVIGAGKLWLLTDDATLRVVE